ncbi:hypothetical protein [Skermania piniformis]|uniref:Cyclodehydratase n=1 Tax=Skermania pinensis TaxID=39122 RepID=A0ABX8S8M4_9ACTN|nr:hypothetical protein [Skermania piniformis]QXQ12855.1 hypothetical protein KV203_13095 [Skermania piniformis]
MPALPISDPDTGPQLLPSLAVLDRPDGRLQLGWDPERAVVVTPPAGTDALALRAVLLLLDGQHSPDRIVVTAAEWGLSARHTQALLDELAEAGLLADRRSTPPLLTTIRVHGRGPLSDAIATGLANGTVRITRSGAYRSTDDAARWLVDLVVLADDLVPDPRLVADLHRLRIPHLPVRMRDGRGMLGPLVLPGDTSCLRCADLTRSDVDPEWPQLAAQLFGRIGRAAPAALQATVSLALHEIVTIRSGSARRPPACLDATVELDLDGHRLTIRPGRRHPLCTCSHPARSQRIR